MQRRTIVLIALIALVVAGCASRSMPEIQPMPMLTMKAAPGHAITVSGIGELALYYQPDSSLYQDQASLAWAGVASKALGIGLPILGMWGQAYTLSSNMVKMAPLFGDGNLSVQPSNFSGQQDIRLLSPNQTSTTTTSNTGGAD